MMQIPLTKGLVALVDDDDYDFLMQWKWCASDCSRGLGTKFYAVTQIRTFEYKRKRIYMHRVIMGEPLNLCVDHINGDSLDNRKENLRSVTVSENAAHKQPSKSKYDYLPDF